MKWECEITSGEKKRLELLINTWNTVLLLFPVNTSLPHGRTTSAVYQRILFCLISVLLIAAVSPAERGELGGDQPEAGVAVSQQVPVSNSKHESAQALCSSWRLLLCTSDLTWPGLQAASSTAALLKTEQRNSCKFRGENVFLVVEV